MRNVGHGRGRTAATNRRRTWGRLAAVVAIVGAGQAIPADAAPTAPRDPDATVHAWVAGFQDGGPRGTNPAVTPQQMAANFDLIIEQSKEGAIATAGLVDQLHGINPALDALVYLSGCCLMSKDTFAYPESSYAHDAAGRRVMSGFGKPLMNRRDPTWRNRRASWCQSLVNQYHVDGCFFDSFGFNWFTANGTPIDPATGQPWTQVDYDAAGQEILAQVRATVRTVDGQQAKVALNGLVHGKTYFKKARWNLLGSTDYAMSELFIVHPHDAVTAYRAEADWKYDVDMVADVGNRGKHFIGTVKSWTAGTQAQKDQLLRYATASFLLGAHPTVTPYLNFQDEHGQYGGSQYYAMWNAALGAPTGPYVKTGNCYVRPFANGKVVVNPTTSSCSYALGGAHTDTNGNTVTNASLPTHTANIYTRVL